MSEDFSINKISSTVPVVVFAKPQQIGQVNEVEKICITFPLRVMRGLGWGHLLCGLLAISFQVLLRRKLFLFNFYICTYIVFYVFQKKISGPSELLWRASEIFYYQ